jgi:hypothetical protein
MDDAVVEFKKRFSESLLWKLQEEAYKQFGPEAWAKKGVPFYLTSNPRTVNQYIQVILGYIRDCLAEGAATPIDLNEPLYCFDLGAGSGRFSYLFLKEWEKVISTLFPQLKLRFIMTDIAEKNIHFWQQHPQLSSFVQNGLLDFAYYHHSQSEAITLLNSGNKILASSLKNPIVLISNYFFDTIPQDLFRIRGGKLEEGFCSLRGVSRALDDPTLIMSLTDSYDYEPINSLKGYYLDFPDLLEILEWYQSHFDEISFLFPVGAFRSIRYFSELSGSRLLWLAADQGVCTPGQIRDWGEPKISRHSSFSVAVDYHALSLYFQQQEGTALLTRFPDPIFVVGAFILGGKKEHFLEATTAFFEHIDSFEPSDYWKMGECMETQASKPSLEYMLLLLKLGHWDPVNLNAFFKHIQSQLPSAKEDQKRWLSYAIDRSWENLYVVSPEEGHFVINLGVLCYEMGDYRKAIEYFEQSLLITGEREQTRRNIALCKQALNRLLA